MTAYLNIYQPNMLCSDESLTLTGDGDSFNSTVVSILFESCTNKPNCRSRAEIDDFFAGFSLMLFSNKRTLQTPVLSNFTAFEVQSKSVVNWFEFTSSAKETTFLLKRSSAANYDEVGSQLLQESLFRLEHYKTSPLPQARYPAG